MAIKVVMTVTITEEDDDKEEAMKYCDSLKGIMLDLITPGATVEYVVIENAVPIHDPFEH